MCLQNSIASLEPGEDWFCDYEKQAMIESVRLLRPMRVPGISPCLDLRDSPCQLGIAAELRSICTAEINAGTAMQMVSSSAALYFCQDAMHKMD
jgi:hypothetical protein